MSPAAMALACLACAGSAAAPSLERMGLEIGTLGAAPRAASSVLVRAARDLRLRADLTAIAGPGAGYDWSRGREVALRWRRQPVERWRLIATSPRLSVCVGHCMQSARVRATDGGALPAWPAAARPAVVAGARVLPSLWLEAAVAPRWSLPRPADHDGWRGRGRRRTHGPPDAWGAAEWQRQRGQVAWAAWARGGRTRGRWHGLVGASRSCAGGGLAARLGHRSARSWLRTDARLALGARHALSVASEVGTDASHWHSRLGAALSGHTPGHAAWRLAADGGARARTLRVALSLRPSANVAALVSLRFAGRRASRVAAGLWLRGQRTAWSWQATASARRHWRVALRLSVRLDARGTHGLFVRAFAVGHAFAGGPSADGLACFCGYQWGARLPCD